MKKQLLVSTLALFIITATSSATMAENSFTKGLKNVGSEITKETKGIVNDIKTGVQKDVENTATATKKAKIAELQKLKDEKLKPLNDEIAAKKKEIEAVKSSKVTETEKAAKLALLNRQLKYLETKKTNLENTYNNKINAFK